MVCKWCGAAVVPGEKNCPECNREIPSLTECAGFSNITRNLVAAQARHAEPVEPVRPAVVESYVPKVPASENKGRSLATVVPLITVALLVIAIVLVVILSVRIGKLNDRVSALEAFHYDYSQADPDDLDADDEDESGLGSAFDPDETTPPTVPDAPSDTSAPTAPEQTTVAPTTDETSTEPHETPEEPTAPPQTSSPSVPDPTTGGTVNEPVNQDDTGNTGSADQGNDAQVPGA